VILLLKREEKRREEKRREEKRRGEEWETPKLMLQAMALANRPHEEPSGMGNLSQQIKMINMDSEAILRSFD
jgi:hypothetical protein